MEELSQYRRKSRGWALDGCAYIHPRILFADALFIDQDTIKEHNIKYVVNCAWPAERATLWFRNKKKDNYTCIEAKDSLEDNITIWYPEFEKAVTNFLRSDSEGKVFVHCQCGINRSGFLCLLYACVKLGYQYDDVLKSILEQRPCALTNPAFRDQVKKYILSTRSKQ